MMEELSHLMQILIALVFGSYGYTFVCSMKTVKRDELKDVKEKIDKIYDILVKRALCDNKEPDKKEEEK